MQRNAANSMMQRNYCGDECALMANAHHACSNNEYGFLPIQIHNLSRNDFSGKKSVNVEK